MSTEIDKRVVEMQFNNKDFEKNVQTSLNTIDKLKMALNFDGAKGLDSITKAADKMDMSNVVKQTEKVKVSLSSLEIVGATVVSRLTNSFLNLGKNLVSGALGQAKSGGIARALKIEQATFKMQALIEKMDGFEGSTEKVNQALKDMDKAIDNAVTGTAYGYDSAASVAAQLMASGLTDTEQMETDLRTIAGAAAMTGRSYDDMGRIFAAVAGQGKVMGDQLLQFSSSGVNAAAVLAKSLHKTEAEIREMVSKGQIDFRTFADAMEKAYSDAAGRADDTFSGVMSNVKAQLSRIGQIFAKPYIKNMIPFLQKVKGALKELNKALSPTGERFDRIFGRLTNWGAKVVDDLDFTRLDTIIRGVENLLWGLASVLYTVHEAFEEMFTKKSLNELNSAAIGFERFTESILPSREVLDGIKTAARLTFAVLKVGVNTIAQVSKLLKPLSYFVLRILGSVTALVRHLNPLADVIATIVKESRIVESIVYILSDILNGITNVIIGFTDALDGALGEFSKLDVVKEFGDCLVKVYKIISTMLVIAVTLLGAAIMKLLSYMNMDSVLKVANKVKSVFKQIGRFISIIALGIVKIFKGMLSLSDVAKAAGDVFKNIASFIGNLFNGNDTSESINNTTDSVNGLTGALKKMADRFKESWSGINKGQIMMIVFGIAVISLIFAINRLLDSVSGLVGAATNSVNAIASIKDSIEEIASNFASFSAPSQFLIAFAIAVSAITASLVTLTNDVDTQKLKEVAPILGAFAAGMIAAAFGLAYANKYFASSVGLSVVAANMLAISASLLILVFAVKSMAKLTTDISDLISVTVAVIIMMTGLAGSVAILAAMTPEFTLSMWSMLGFAGAMYLLIKSLQQLATVDISTIWRQAILLGGLMLALGGAIGLASKAGSIYKRSKNDVFKQGGIGFTLLAFSIAMLVLLKVLDKLCDIPAEQMKTGLQNIRNMLMSFMPLIVVIALASKLAGAGGMLMVFKDISALFLSLTFVLIAVSAVILIFSKTMSPEELDRGVDAVDQLIRALTRFIIAVMGIPLLISSLVQMRTGRMMNLGSSTLVAVAGILGAVSILMLALAICARIIDDVKPNTVHEVISILIAMTFLVGVIEGMATFTSTAKATVVLAMMGVIAVIIGGLAFLAAAVSMGGIDFGILILTFGGLILVLLALAVLVSTIADMEAASTRTPVRPRPTARPQSSGLKSVAMIFGLAAICASIGLLMDTVKDMHWTTVAAMFVGLTVVFITLAVLVSKTRTLSTYANPQILTAMSSLYPIIISMIALVAAFAILTEVIRRDDSGSWAVALAVMAGMMVAIGAMLAGIVLVGNELRASALSMKETLAAIAIISGCIAALMLVVALVYAIPVNKEGLGQKIATIIILLAALAGLMMMSKLVNPIAVMQIAYSIAAMSVAFVMIAGAIAIISSTPTDEKTNVKLLWLMGIFVVLAATVALAAVFINATSLGVMLTLAGTMIAFAASLVIIALAMTTLSKIPAKGFDRVSKTLQTIITIFAVLVGLAAVAGVFGGGGAALAVAAVAAGFLAFGVTLLAVAKSLDIFAAALQKLASFTEESMQQIWDNIHAFFTGLPQLARDLMEFGPWIAVIIAQIITNIALGVSSAIGAVVNIATTLIGGFCAGLIAGLPAILETLGVVISEIANWIINNKDIFIDTGRAITIAVVGVMQGIIQGFFDYFDVRLQDIFQACEDAKQAMNDNEQVQKTGSERMRDSMTKYYHDIMEEDNGMNYGQKTYLWLDELQNRIDLGVLSYEDAMQAISDVGLDAYSDYIDRMGEMSGYMIGEDEMAIKQLEATTSEAGKTLVTDLKKVAKAAMEANNGVYSIESINTFINGLNKGIAEGTISYRYALLQLYELGLQDYSDNLSTNVYMQAGQETSEQIAEGIEKGNEEVKAAVDETVEIVEDAEDKLATGGGYKIGNGVNLAYAMPNDRLKNLSTTQAMALRDAITNEEGMKTIGEGLAEDGGEAFADEVEKENWIDKIGKFLKPVADTLGVDLGGILANGMGEGLSSSDIVGSVIAAIKGEEYKTRDEWQEYLTESVPLVKEFSNGMRVNVGYQQRWQTMTNESGKAYESLEEAMRDNVKTGEDYFNFMHGTGGMLDEVNEAMGDMLPNMEDLTAGMGELGDVTETAAEKVDKLKESIESALDVFTEFNKEVNLTGREVLANFYSQLDGITSWQKELEALASRGLNKNFLNQLAEEGPQAYERIHALYSMTEAEMTLFNTMYAQKLMIQKNTANDIRKSFVSTGNMLDKEVDNFTKSAAEKYGEQLAEAQAKAAESKTGEIKDSTMKSLEELEEEMRKEAADNEFIEQWKDYIGSSTVKLDLMNAFTQLGNSSVDAFAKSLNFQKVMEKILEFRKTVKEQVKSSLNLFDEVQEVEEKDKITTTEILNNMEENLKRVGGWANNIKKMISMGFSEGLVEELRQMGPESADKVEAFIKMTADEVSRANAYWGDSVKLPETISNRLTEEYSKAGFEISLGLKKGLDEGSEDFYDYFKVAGEDASQGYVDGINAEAANEAMDQLGQNTLDRLMTKLDEHSPSREMMKIGTNAVAGYLIGLKNGIKGLNPFIRDLSSKVLNGFADSISLEDTMGDGVNDILNTMTDELYNVGNAANMIDLDNVYEPVIRPVWDTTAIETGFTTIDQFLSGKIISLKAVDAAAQRSGPSQDAVMITNAINNLYNEQKIIRNDINNIRSDVSSLGNRIDGMRVVLDGNALVGELVAPLDKAMGNKVVKQKRGRV